MTNIVVTLETNIIVALVTDIIVTLVTKTIVTFSVQYRNRGKHPQSSDRHGERGKCILAPTTDIGNDETNEHTKLPPGSDRALLWKKIIPKGLTYHGSLNAKQYVRKSLSEHDVLDECSKRFRRLDLNCQMRYCSMRWTVSVQARRPGWNLKKVLQTCSELPDARLQNAFDCVCSSKIVGGQDRSRHDSL